MSSLLFVAPADLGETVLSTGALDYAMARLEAPAVTIVCDPAAADLFRALPNLSALHTWGSDEGFAAGARLVWSLGRTPFDLAIDLNGSAAAFTFAAKSRFIRSPARVRQHLVEELTALMGADHNLTPKLWLDDAARAAATGAVAGTPLLALAPGGVSASKRWAPDRFAATARRLLDGALKGAQVVLLGAAARDADVTRTIAASLDADGLAARDLGRGLDLLGAAALLEQATLCLGNDNALTHIAAAVGAPTLTLFGPTDERVRAPFGPRTRTLRGRPFDEMAALPALDERAAMEDVSVDAAEAAALELLHAGGLR